MPKHRLSFRILISLLLLSLLMGGAAPSHNAAAGHQAGPMEAARVQLAELTPEEKVGQLFLITFSGSSVDPDTAINNLITNYHVGGLILKRENDHFENYSTLPEDARLLINQLQWTEYRASRDQPLSSAGSDLQSSSYLPLLIGLSHEGNQSQYTEIIHGLSPIPSQLSLGATWDTSLAERTGETVGEELSLLGVNLLFGPSLDVLVDPAPGQSDLGVRSFGGDPYWVGEMGKAYTRGVHNGSRGSIAVIGKYFPGLGSADRLPEEEIATVRKSLEQLKQIDLAPFFSVTGDAPSPAAAVDGLLNSHIRYQGLQGNIRSTTRPISLDPQAFNLLMGLEEFETWRNQGGLVISDNLASQAVRQLYDPTGTSFNIRQVALDAFIAGNDMLYLGNTGSENQPTPSEDIIDTLEFFAQKYREDEAFAERVDESVVRILALKNKIYPLFNITTVTTTRVPLENLEKSDISSSVVRQSATLINPDIAELDTILPSPPTSQDRLVIISDVITQKACSDCPDVSIFGKADLENAILRLYGPLSGGRLVRANLTSYTYKETMTMLDFPSDMSHMETDLYNADWILVAALDLSEDRPTSQALHRLLSERQDLLRDKKILVFALGAPYYLDATNISKISALYGLYNHLPSSIEIAARLLFKEIPSPNGRLPVSVPGIGYDLISATSPDPERSFSIFVENLTKPESSPDTLTETPSAPVFELEDLIQIRTGIIRDYNGNPVPDGTPVDFVISSQGIDTYLPEVYTKDGSASISYLIDRPVNFELQAISSPAQSNTIQINVIGSEDGEGLFLPTISPEADTSPTTTPGETPTPGVFSTPETGQQSQQAWRFWLLSMLVTLSVGMIAYQVGASFGFVRWGIRWGFSALIGGFLIYNYLMLNLPGSAWASAGDSFLRQGLTIFFASSSGWLISFLSQKVKH